MRNPFLVAKAVATAAVLSRGRISLGVGAGWMRDEFELMGQDFRNRGARMDEMLAVMRKLWAGGWVEHHGRYYDFERLEMTPVPPGPIPIYVGGVSEPAMRRAARHDGWISDLHTTDELRGHVERLRGWRNEGERAGEPIEVIASASDAFDADGFRRLEDAGVTQALAIPWYFYGGPTEDLSRKLDGIRRFGDEVIAKV